MCVCVCIYSMVLLCRSQPTKPSNHRHRKLMRIHHHPNQFANSSLNWFALQLANPHHPNWFANSLHSNCQPHTQISSHVARSPQPCMTQSPISSIVGPKGFSMPMYLEERERERDVGLILCIMYSILHFKSFCIPRWECSKLSQPTNKFLLSIITISRRDWTLILLIKETKQCDELNNANKIWCS